MAKEASKVLKRIAIIHFEKKYGNVTILDEGQKGFWEFNGKKFKPHFCTDKASIRFTGVALSKDAVELMIEKNACFMPIQYYKGDENKFRVYCIQPQLILKHYINADVVPKKGSNSYHITIRHEGDRLIFTRRGTSEVAIPIDENNYCIRYEMNEDEYNSLKEVLGIREPGLREFQKTLKVVVSDKEGSREFSIRSAIVIAIISILVKCRKPLTREDILEEIIDYGVLTRGKNEIGNIKDALRDLTATGGLVASDGRYTISDNIKVEVEL